MSYCRMKEMSESDVRHLDAACENLEKAQHHFGSVRQGDVMLKIIEDDLRALKKKAAWYQLSKGE